MALTMTRKRTQTALTKLAQLLADVNGELAFLVETVARPLVPLTEADSARLRLRRAQLDKSRAALCMTIRQFDPSIDPDDIGSSENWLHTRARTARSRQRVYLATLRTTTESEGHQTD